MKHVNQKRLFIAGCLALLVTAITFAIRAKIEGVFTDVYGLSKEEVGRAFAPAFWGFAVAMFAGGYFIDIVKTKSIIWAAFVMHFIGIVLLLMAKDYTSLFIANVFIGLGNGSVEAACNPLVTALFPDKKNPACRKADGAVSLFLLCVSAGELIHHPLLPGPERGGGACRYCRGLPSWLPCVRNGALPEPWRRQR